MSTKSPVWDVELDKSTEDTNVPTGEAPNLSGAANVSGAEAPNLSGAANVSGAEAPNLSGASDE